MTETTLIKTEIILLIVFFDFLFLFYITTFKFIYILNEIIMAFLF
jgi:hypothetical protein